MPADPLWAETIPATAPPPFPSVEELNLLCGLTDLDSYEVPDVMQSQKLNPPASIPLSGYDYVFASDTDGSQSPLAHDRAQKDDQFEGIGNWPRRLLHVPSMTSLEWQPGDQYGGHVAPRYNAVSYTWGRYDLDFPGTKKIKKYRNIKAIEIDGVTWRVPRINPTHFSVDHFQHLIWQTCEPVDDSRERIDFLWLDVACIDQNDGSQKSAEIGRQAVIFHGAQRVFVWLTKVLGDRLSHIVTNLLQSTNAAMAYAEEKKQDSARVKAFMSWLATARASLDDIFIDPWFTSLWTLQEAFLCQNAYILPLEAHLTAGGSEPSFKIGSHTTLEAICTMSTTLNQVIKSERPIVQAQWQANRADPDIRKRLKYLEEVYNMLNQRGILALATRNPIALYNIAQYRCTMHDRDRVYGIQQIFGLRLGTSAPGVSDSRSKYFNRFVLEDQLGAAILVEYPVASQLHNFTEPVEEGRGWRVSGSSTVPSLDIQSSIWGLGFDHRCQLVTEKIKGHRWGSFRGQTCDFADLSRAWKTVHETLSISKLPGAKSPQQIMLDTFLHTIGDESLNDPEEPLWTAVWSKRKEIPRDGQQHRLAWGLNALVPKKFEGELPLVLLLGSFIDGSQDDEQAIKVSARYHVGLIVVHKKAGTSPYWKRLGFCIWQYEYSDAALESIASPLLALMRAEDHGVGWKSLSGLLG
ncbi:MAG: hypothetical protein ASARMPRED_001188 [Alectoria sarmentosa]|nr:MAG: hypothetical protein ASARMPRED_001188 [Alectoria sarmentosa]